MITELLKQHKILIRVVKGTSDVLFSVSFILEMGEEETIEMGENSS